MRFRFPGFVLVCCVSCSPFYADSQGPRPERLSISRVQGSGASSPFAGKMVTTSGIVVGDFQADDELDGFFLQDPAGDLEPGTSDGIFVYDPGGRPVTVGDRLTIVARVVEYHGMTELAEVREIVVMGSGKIRPTPVRLPERVDGDLECFEGMLIELTVPMTVTQTYFLGRYGQLTLAGPDDHGQPGRLRKPANVFNPGVNPESFAALADENRRRMIVIDDGQDVRSRGDNPDPVPYLAGSPRRVVRAGDSVSNLIGCLGYGRINSGFGPALARDYRLHPTRAPIFRGGNPRPKQPRDVDSRLRVATFNVRNYFNGDGRGGGFPTSRGADTPSEFVRQRAKIVDALITLDAHIVGLVEIENDGYGADSAIRDLVEGLNETTTPAAWGFVTPPRAALRPDGRLGGDRIAVGFVYRNAAVAPVGAAVSNNRGAFDPGVADGGANRVPLAQTFEELASGERITVVVNHFKSKRSSGSPAGGNLDAGDGQGSWNRRRTDAARELAQWLAGDPTGLGESGVLIVGDLNAYANEDPILELKGAGYVDLIGRYNGTRAYTFIYDGEAGYLDHALADAAAASRIVSVVTWPINADEPEVLGYDEKFNPPGYYRADPFRSSDHDPVLIGIFANDGADVEREP